MRKFPPEPIVCLTEEAVKTPCLLGEGRRIVGVAGYGVRPKSVRQQKPRVAAFTSAGIPKILALGPDLALTFADLQADIEGSGPLARRTPRRACLRTAQSGTELRWPQKTPSKSGRAVSVEYHRAILFRGLNLG